MTSIVTLCWLPIWPSWSLIRSLGEGLYIFFGIAILSCMRYYIPLCLDCKFHNSNICRNEFRDAIRDIFRNLFQYVFQEIVPNVCLNVFKHVGLLQKNPLQKLSISYLWGGTSWSGSTGSRFGSFSDYMLALMTSIRHSKMIEITKVPLTFWNIEWIMNSQNPYFYNVTRT